jgi:hypothetical protein
MAKLKATANVEPTIAITNGNAATSDGAPRPNASDAQMVADTYRDRLDAHRDELMSGVARIEKIVAGDKDGEGYNAAVALAPLHLDLTELVFWRPNDTDNEIEKVINAEQNVIYPKASPAAYNALSNAMFLAVCASGEAVAAQARIGGGNEKQPQFRYVQVRKLCDPSIPEKDRKGAFGGTSADAKAQLQALHDGAKASPDDARVYASALAAIDDMERLRRLGNEIAALGMAKSRVRKLVYTKAIEPLVDDFVATDPKESIGDVWVGALGRAAQAHQSYMSAQKKAVKPATVPELEAAIRRAVWTEYLQPKIGTVDKEKASEEEVTANLVKKMWASIDAIDKAFAGLQIGEAVTTTLNTLIRTGRDDVAHDAGLVTRPVKKGATAKKDTVGQIGADNQADADADEADQNNAKVQRTAQRNASAGGQVAATPPRRTVASPAVARLRKLPAATA